MLGFIADAVILCKNVFGNVAVCIYLFTRILGLSKDDFNEFKIVDKHGFSNILNILKNYKCIFVFLVCFGLYVDVLSVSMRVSVIFFIYEQIYKIYLLFSELLNLL